jgi:hypothetical protein
VWPHVEQRSRPASSHQTCSRRGFFIGEHPRRTLSLALLIASITLTGGHFVLRFVFDILPERFSDVDDVIELTLLVPSYIALVLACIDQLSLALFCFRSHKASVHLKLKPSHTVFLMALITLRGTLWNLQLANREIWLAFESS